MSVLTIRLPDEHHERLKEMAKARGISLNKLFEYISISALSEFDAETRFRIRAANGNAKRTIEILDKLDKEFN